MEVATTNNHSQSHHHHPHHHHHLQTAPSSGSGVGIVSGIGGSRSPFQREVREWQRIDPNTGALFSGRLEADRWINGPLNSYGKKSSSSISSQSSNNSNLTTAAAQASNTHTHRSAGKISLHAIVGPESSSSLSSSSSPAAWAKQADLYGQPPSRVGGAGTGVAGGADADVAATPPTHRRDLESFRHYNDDGNSNNDDEELRLTARHQRRQQVSQSVYAPPLPSLGSSMLQRSRSISTDDLSNDWEREDKSEQPTGEWRRVSKLRRSFQSQEHYKSPAVAARPRPLDLPGNSVSVARLRAELENGRRLNTAMRNNHVDLAALDTILNSPTAKPTVAKRNTFLTAESLQEIRGKLKKLSDESLYKEDFLAYHQKKKEPSVEKLAAPQLPAPSAFRPVHNTHSLESRQRQKDTSSSEWHLRRKSYGFEKMSPPEDKSIFRVDASTDSGLGRSGEQLGNWSPTERSGATMPQQPHNGGGTIIHFGRAVKPVQISPSPTEGELSKRHSIAVEETWRDLRKTSQVHVNGGTVTRSSTTTSSSFNNHLQRGSAQKRVEFCKTEVHFAAESGRVNIVETDGKPPPTQNFRRRRRTASGPLQSLVKSASTVSGTNDSVTQFGDDSQRRKTIATSTVAYRATLMDPPEVVSQQVATQSAIGSSSTVSSTSSSAASTLSSSQVTVTTEPRYSLMESTSRNSYTSTSGVDTTDNETDELSNIRGILKNKPVKPKPYHLGENIESADVLWSVPAMKTDRESPSARDSGTTSVSPITTKSVAERIRIVEQRQHQPQPSPSGNGYSTKINVSLGASEDWPDAGTHLHQQRHRHRRPSAQELLLEDLRQHQRILDEGLKSTSLIMRTMRSASEFDEAMRRLSIASIESALVQPTIVVPTPMLRSHSYQEEGYIPSRRPSTISTTSITSSDLFGSALYDSLPRTPLAPPRLKLLGNTQIPVSQQLIQLRRLYDAADQDQDQEDSADEEVKRYFRDNNSDSGGGTQGSSSPEQQRPAEVFQGSEYSSSWSRMKAKRTIWKIETQDQILQRADLPKSNVMNIALHAPRVEKPKATPPTLRIGQLVPVAKPRTLFIQPQIHDQAPADAAEDSSSETLKIIKEARGARKLREHELSYFGVQQQQASQTKLSTGSTNPRRTLPSRSRSIHSEEASSNGTTKTTTKWQLLNDRPDLLRHSSPQHNDIKTTHDYDEDENENEEHCYENIANELTTTFRVKSPSPSPDRSRSRSPGSYERKRDLQRDAQILSEMTRNADQTLKALSDEAAIKDQRRRSCSLQRRSSKPLETIDEKVKVYPASQSLGVARGTFASEARRNSRQSTPSPTRARSSSQSSIECCPRDRSRSSSRESMTQGGGSSDDQMATKHRAERLRLRTPKREKSRHETQESELRIKPRTRSSAHAAGSSSLESKRSSHHGRNSNREVEKSSETKTSSGSRLVRSSRVAEENRSRQSGLRERDRERSRGSEKHREELSRSRGHSSRSRHSEHTTSGTRESSRPSKTRSSRSSHDSATPHKKSTTTTTSTTSAKKSSKTTAHHTATTTSASAPPTSHNELTYVYVTNLANTQTDDQEAANNVTEGAEKTVVEAEAENEADYASIEEMEGIPLETPLPPPRTKRKRSLIPVPVGQPASYEYRTKLEMIPPSYSNQSTLKCRSVGRRKPSLKATQSTSSSFAFMPYLPAKRNSSVSHVYDNYLLYATSESPAKLDKLLRPYQNNLSNDHSQLFGGGAAAGGVARRTGGRLGGWPRRLKMRQVRSSVSTHQPFGICTCS
ncbi:serine-rich adhesin for platelets isoform X3 [Drosophila bipectinata]|uniref:serine-rich adhesin for platelets isoform X3 n=1 Tax=Drosophila bipectinata TaxID=42026 RepID=UPI001C8AA73B|nr:serine-rich adhesin for platelets isoform X3 [Drosophila bipectinata]